MRTSVRVVDRDVLAGLVDEGLSVNAMAARLGIAPAAVRTALRRHGLQTLQGAKRQQSATSAQRGDAKADLPCRHHGVTPHVLEGHGRYRCLRCRSEQVARHRRRLKETLVAEAGGRCVLCGYDRCRAALQFHHVDPASKAFHLSHEGVTRSIDAARAEAAKCVLLCATCHAEVEDGFTTLIDASAPREAPRGGLEPPNLD